MSIDAQGWLSWAIRRPGPANKVYAEKNRNEGLCCHSAEGWLAGIFGELDNPNRAASWHFTNAISGEFYQHYPVTSSTWTSGNYEANVRYWATESEGLAATPLNDKQVDNMLTLAQEFEAYTGKVATRATADRTVWMHREVAQKWSPNAGPTACPSERYQPFFIALDLSQEADMGMTPEQLARLDAAEKGVYQLQTQVFGTNGIVDAYVTDPDTGALATQRYLLARINNGVTSTGGTFKVSGTLTLEGE